MPIESAEMGRYATIIATGEVVEVVAYDSETAHVATVKGEARTMQRTDLRKPTLQELNPKQSD